MRRAPTDEPIGKRRGAAFQSSFRTLVVASALLAAGYADFPLIAYHFQKVALFPPAVIPLAYAVAMATDGLAALALGRLHDRWGAPTLAAAALAASVSAPLVFLGGPALALVGLALWGVGLGAMESVLRAGVATRVPVDRRATAFGIFNAVLAAAWFLGSAALGGLYGISIPALVVLATGLQVVAAVVFLRSGPAEV